jgi:general secretion pathway protein E/type IV pilus assembly protein PilB
MTPALRQSLVNILLASGCASEQDAQELAAKQNNGDSWTNTVLNSGKVDESRFTAELGRLFRTPVEAVNLNRFDRSCLGALPSRFVFKHHVLPLGAGAGENSVRLATYDVFNSVARKLAQQIVAKKVEWVLVPRTQLLRAIKTLYGVGAETFDELLKSSRALEEVDERNQSMDLNAEDAEASVVKFVNQIIREAVAERATDIHVEPLENDLRIRYRIDGILHEVAVPGQLRLLQSAIISRLKVMAHMDIAERRLPQDGRINLQSGVENIDVRVSTIPTVNGESISLRLLTRTEQQFNFDLLQLDERQSNTVRGLLAQPNGIILVTGPTGSGKSTSLYAFLTSINAVSRRIITIEEPVEYRLPGVSQIDVKPEIGLTFAIGLRHILRQDPNVVMVGEIRDFETAEIAIRAAMTGHLVFSTLHTNDAVSGITRLLDMGIEPFLLSSVVRAFIAQRLVRTICPDCVEAVDYPEDYLREIGAPIAPDHKYYRGAGCETCRQTGYRGRVAIFEFCVVNEKLQRLIVSKASGVDLKACAMQNGMLTLRHDGWRRVRNRQTTIEEVVRVTQTDEILAET